MEKLESENSDFKEELSNHQIITNTIDETFWLSDFQNRKVLYVSPSYERMFGMSLESLYEDPSLWETYIHPQDKARIRNASNNKIPTNTYDEEFRIVKEDGVVQWVRDRAYSVSDENGNLKLIAGTTQYITKAKEAEFKLKETTENLSK